MHVENEQQDISGESFGLEFLVERHGEAYKILGAGNGAGVLTIGAALHYFQRATHILDWLKASALFFFLGLFLFLVAYLYMIKFTSVVALTFAGRERSAAIATVSTSIHAAVLSVYCFTAGCLLALFCVLKF